MLPSIREKIKCTNCKRYCCRFEYEKLTDVITLRDRCKTCQGAFKRSSKVARKDIEMNIEFYKFQLYNIYKEALTNKKIRKNNGIEMMEAKKFIARCERDGDFK